MDFLASRAVTSRKSHVLQALRILPSFHDKTFEEAYRDAYTGILKGIWEQSAYDVELARKVLSWVIFTKDPQNLTIDMVQRALFFEDEIDETGTDIDITDDKYDEIPEEKLSSVCRGLLTVDHHGRTLHVAAYFGLRLMAMTLLEKPQDIEAKDLRGWDPLRWAIFGESDALVALLFDHKASLVSEDHDGL